MASRKEQKEQARAARVAREQELAAGAQRTRRMQLFGGAIVAALAVIVVAVVISSGGSGPHGLQQGPRANRTYQTVNQLLSGIPQHGRVLGNPNAKVTMTYYGDLECPVCRDFTLGAFSQFVPREVRSGRVKVEYRSLCTATCGVNTTRFKPQEVAAYAAGKQSLFWQYAELFYREQGDETTPYPTEQYLRALARQIPTLDFTRWLADRGDPSLDSQVAADQALATKQGLPQSTPQVVMSGPKGAQALDPHQLPTLDQLTAAVRAVS